MFSLLLVEFVFGLLSLLFLTDIFLAFSSFLALIVLPYIIFDLLSTSLEGLLLSFSKAELELDYFSTIFEGFLVSFTEGSFVFTSGLACFTV